MDGKMIEAGSRWAEVERTEDGRVILRGDIVCCDVPNHNGRIYPRAVMEAAVVKAQESIQRGSFFAVIPDDRYGRVHLADVAGRVRALAVGERVRGDVEMLDTDRGKSIRVLMDAGKPVRLYLRGRGSLREVDGVQVVQDDFVFDGVGITAEE
jgi:hypothetical protein